MPDLPKSFEPTDSEQKWFQLWESRGFFKPEVNPEGEAFSIVIPPPNVTGALHMGHALNATLQDILIRWKRMSGFKALWLPGTDHAGIATQNVVERELAAEGLDRHKLGREEFIKRVWQWKARYGERIFFQLRRMGASCDWSRQRFTLDEGLSKAVKTVFAELYREGLIYRALRLINWCPRCLTALSDLEVEHEEIDGLLTYIKYPFADLSGFVVVATTRPETMLGDTAVAVNPGDERYKDVIGKVIELPLSCRQIPVIADPEVDPSFGTGAVKITPAHDFNDEAVARRQVPPIPSVKVIGVDGKMTPEAGMRYAGLDRYEARKLVLNDLKSNNLLVKQQPHRHPVGHCYRCKTIIEPLSTLQWYVKVAPLAQQAVQAVRDKRIRIIPEAWEKNYFSWMENIKDWCISRQIWWGHRIPVWYCGECGQVIVSAEDKEPGETTKCPSCGSAGLRQDPDVLDTWFSSALWPFSTLGWPEKTADLETFYPTSVLVTAFDILFFWVARMIMMGVKFMGEVPFGEVYIHALVRDEEGAKMSKSKGNVIDPILMVEKYGADAFRFTLAAFAAQGRDIKFSEERVKGYKNFINKIWNAARFILMNTETEEFAAPATDLPSRWILSRLTDTAEEVGHALAEYRFNDASQRVYHFLWHEFCDWYIETAKTGLQDEASRKGVRWCLLYTLESALRVLHPFMPFVTEELWQRMPQEIFTEGGGGRKESIMVSSFPAGPGRDPEAERLMGLIMEVVTAARNIRGELNIQPGARIELLINSSDPEAAGVLGEHAEYLKRLTGAFGVRIGSDIKRPRKAAASGRPGFELYVPVEGLVDIGPELERLRKELKKASGELDFCRKKLMDPDFISRAPRQVVEKENAKCAGLEGKLRGVQESIKRLKSLEVE